MEQSEAGPGEALGPARHWAAEPLEPLPSVTRRGTPAGWPPRPDFVPACCELAVDSADRYQEKQETATQECPNQAFALTGLRKAWLCDHAGPDL